MVSLNSQFLSAILDASDILLIWIINYGPVRHFYVPHSDKHAATKLK